MAKKISEKELEKLVEKMKNGEASAEEKLKALKALNSLMKEADKLVSNLAVAMKKQINK